MSAKKSKVTVEIYGEPYNIKGEGEPERIRRVALLVNEQMKQIALANPSLTPAKIAVLAALNIADEFLRLEEDYRQMVRMLQEEKP